MAATENMKRLLNRHSFAEAGALAQKIAKSSGRSVKVKRQDEMFAIWVREGDYAAIYPIASSIIEAARKASARQWSSGDSGGGDCEYDDPELDAYQDEVHNELREELSQDTQQYAASKEDGWFHPDDDRD